MSDDRENEDYEVGYKKPPKSSQFQKGASGNPSGRPKKLSDFHAIFLRELNSPVRINENGKLKIISKDEAIAKQVVNKAASGQVHSIRLADIYRREALDKAAEKERLAKRPIDELSDEELMEMIYSGYEKNDPRRFRRISNVPDCGEPEILKFLDKDPE
jgi:hypothetical protein